MYVYTTLSLIAVRLHMVALRRRRGEGAECDGVVRRVVVEAQSAGEPEEGERVHGAVRSCAPERLAHARAGELHFHLDRVGALRRIFGVDVLSAGSLDVHEFLVLGRQRCRMRGRRQHGERACGGDHAQ